MPKRALTISIALTALLATPAATARTQAAATPTGIVLAQTASSDVDTAVFTPRPGERATTIDYGFLDDALKYMVLRMGPSTRQGERRPDPTLGTRMVYGHDSRFRLEGNRVAFSFLEEDAITPLTEYLRELETLGAELDIASLPRNEQLAYWMNLHNVAMIEAIARNYPVQYPSRVNLNGEEVSLDRQKLVTIGSVALSPHDIRTKIVFPNWRDPDVIYGFFRGEIGGPTIQRQAFKGKEMAFMLDGAAREFVNSLRGVESYGKTLLVSKIYEEAAPFYFPDFEQDLKAHLATHAGEDVKDLLATKTEIAFNEYEDRIADLAGGEREPIYNEVVVNNRVRGANVTPSILRLLAERQEKLERLERRGELRGRVIVLPPGNAEAEPEEVE